MSVLCLGVTQIESKSSLEPIKSRNIFKTKQSSSVELTQTKLDDYPKEINPFEQSDKIKISPTNLSSIDELAEKEQEENMNQQN